MFTSVSTSLSQWELERVWHQLRRTTSSLQRIHSLPQTHSTLYSSKGYPSAPEPNSSMFSGNAVLGFCEAPLRRPRPPYTRVEKCYKLLREQTFEVFLLTPDRYRWAIINMLMEETELCDTAGTVRVSEVYIFMNGPCYISHVLTSNIVEYSLRDTISLDQNPWKWQPEVILTLAPLCVTHRWYSVSSKCFISVFLFQNRKI